MKKIVVMLLIVLATSFIATAQVPKPPTGENNDTKGRVRAVRIRTEAVNSGPIGTATTLLLSLGVGAIAYKVRKSNSNRK